MKELFSVLRLAVYVLALPLTVTAAASAHQWMNGTVRAEAKASEVSNVIRLSENGMLRGVVNTYAESGKVSVSNSVVSLLTGDQVVARVNSGIDGAFSFSSISPGRYTFVSASKEAISSFGIEVVAADSEVGASALRAFASPRNSVVENFASAARGRSSQAADGVQVLGAAELVELVDGTFQGKVASFNGNLEGNIISLVGGSEVLAEASTDAEGGFAFTGVEPGFYTVVARGTGGFATVAVQVADSTAVAPAETVYTSLLVRQDGFSVTMTDAPVEYEIVEEIISVEVIEETPVGPVPGYGYGAPGGFAGGGGMGGGMGGGGFGLGGIGELVGLGLGAWLLTEIIGQIDDDGGVPTPVPVPIPPPPASGFYYVYL